MDFVYSDGRGKSLINRPVSERGLKQVGDWWSDRANGKSLRLRSGVLAPGGILPSMHQGVSRNAPMKDLIRRQGLALRLYLVAAYEIQISNRRQKEWTAGPLAERHYWRDENVSGKLLKVPSWATLALGHETLPVTGKREARAWQTSRYKAVASGFARLAELELFDDQGRVLQLEDRPWRRNPDASRAYHWMGRHESAFEVPSVFFTDGDYLRLNGLETYVLLMALQHQSSKPIKVPARDALTSSGWNTGETGLVEKNLWEKYVGGKW